MATDDDRERLIAFLRGMAEAFLRKGPSFPTSGATIAPDGTLAAIKPYADSGPSDPEREVALLEAYFRREAAKGACGASGYCVDVRA